MPADYPLEQLVTIKQKKLEEAEKALRDKKELLTKEQEKLDKVEKERNTAKEHQVAKLTQLRAGLDEGLPGIKINQMKTYLKIVDEKLVEKEKKLTEQKKVIKTAEEAVELARADLIKKQHDVEKLVEHRKEWDQEQKKLEEHKDNIEADELGAIGHSRRKKHK